MLIQMDEKLSTFLLSISQVAAAQTTPGRTSLSQNRQLWLLKTAMSGKHQKLDSVGQQHQPLKVAPKSKEPTLWHTGEISLITTTKAYSYLPMVNWKKLLGYSVGHWFNRVISW